MLEKIKARCKPYYYDLLVVFFIVIVGAGSFGLGRLSVLEEVKADIKIQYPPLVDSPEYKERVRIANEQGIGVPKGTYLPSDVQNGQVAYVASRNGTKYYLPTCSSVNRIKEENKIWFATKEAAELDGYEPAKNCPGL